MDIHHRLGDRLTSRSASHVNPSPRFSLTALNRNTAVLRQAVTDQRLVLLTQHGRVALAVVNVDCYSSNC